jgi:hypothetical protein
MNLAPVCVYTIIHPARLDEYLRKGRKTPLTEKTKWTRIADAFTSAQQRGEELIVMFSDARRCDVLFAWAPLEGVSVGEGTSFSLKGAYNFSGTHRKTALTTLVGKCAISGGYIRPYLPCETPAFAFEEVTHPRPWTYALEDFFEGRRMLRQHLIRERSREAREARIRAANGVLRCEVCAFDFAATYGALGAGFVEVHHREALSSRSPNGRKTRLDELALVCANCHRMLHRREDLTVDELRRLVAEAGQVTTPVPLLEAGP